jgi:hypothetical protein
MGSAWPESPPLEAAERPGSLSPINLGIHWLRGSVPISRIEDLVRWLNAQFGQHTRHEHGLWFYDRSLTWANGMRLNYHSTPERAELTDGWISLEMPGGALEQIDTLGVAWLMQRLVEFEFRCTRIDLAADDLERVITPRELYATVYEEDLSSPYEVVTRGPSKKLRRRPLRQDFTGFKVISYQSQCRADEGCQYDCVAFGRRGGSGSGKYLRVYDKWLESGGDIPAIRWELELSDARAQKVFEQIVGRDLYEVGMVIGTMIASAIDFPVRTAAAGAKNLDRLDRHAFWQTLLERLGTPDKNALALAVPPKSVPKAMGYVANQAMGTMQMLSLALGRDVFLGWLVRQAANDDRLAMRHRDAAAEYLSRLADGQSPDLADLMDFFGVRDLEFDPDLAPEEDADDEMPELRATGEGGRGGGLPV